MSVSSPQAAFFVSGGTVPLGAASYVPREADRALLAALREGRYAYVLTSRQMGKSSLSVRTMEALRQEGVRTAFVDLTRVGGRNVTAEQWYAGLLGEVGRGLGNRAALLAHWKAHAELGPMQRFFGALREAIPPLPSDGEGAGGEGPGTRSSQVSPSETRVVVFIDEIDATRSLSFSTDEFFAGIRECFNRRVQDPVMARLAFCLIGVAIPSDLMSDAKLTPFNVGERVVLRDFSPSEAAALGAGLGPQGPALVARVHHWTGGHPFLTQSLGRRLAETGAQTPQDVDRLVAEEFFEARARETNINLADVGNRVLNSYDDPEAISRYRSDILSLSESVLKGRRVPDDESNRLVAVLKLAGLVAAVDGRLRVRNRIYARVFDATWIEEHLPNQELRRQQRAFRQGMVRAAGLAAAMLAAVGSLAVVAAGNARRANLALVQVQRERDRANLNAAEAKRATLAADAARGKAQGLVLDREKALKDVQAQKARADAQARLARAQTGIANEQRNAADVQKSLAQRNALTAQRNADEARRQRRNAEEQSRLVLATNHTLEGELYESTIQSIGTTWEHEPGEVARLVASVAGHPGKGWEWGYWHRITEAVYTVPNQPARGNKVALAPVDGASCVVYDQNSAQRINPGSGKTLRELWRLPPLSAAVSSYRVPVFSRNGRWAVRDDGRRGRVLQDLERGTVRPLPSAPAGSTLYVDGVSDDGLRVATRIITGTHLSSRRSARLVVWDAPSGRTLATRALVAPFASCAGLSPDGRTALLTYQDDAKGLVGVADYDVERDRVGTVYAFPKPTGYGPTVRFGPGGSRLVSYSSKVAVFDRGRTEPRLVLNVKAMYPSVSTSPDGRFLVTSNLTYSLGFVVDEIEAQIWDLRSGALVAEVPANGVLVGDGTLFLGQTRGGLAGIDWRETQPYRETTVLPDRLPKATEVTASSSLEGSTFLSPALDGEAVVWTVTRSTTAGGTFRGATVALGLYDADGRLLARYPASGELPKGEDATVSGPNLLVRDGERLQVRRLPDQRLARTLLGVQGPMPEVSRDGRWAASIDERGLLRLWSDGPRPAASIPTGLNATSLGSGATPSIFPSSRLLSPDGTRVLGYDETNRFQVWDLRTRRLVAARSVAEPSEKFVQGRWSPDGRAVLALSDRQGLVAYDLASGASRTVLPPDASAANSGASPAFSPDGRLVAFPLAEIVEIRSVQTGRRLFTLDTRLPGEKAFSRQIADLAFSPDGHRLSVLYADGTLRTFRDDG